MMLIRGDLVAIPQGAYVYSTRRNSLLKLPMEMKSKSYGVVVGCMGDDYKVLIVDKLYEVNKKFLQLVEAQQCS